MTAATRALSLPGGATIHARQQDGRWEVVRQIGDAAVTINRVGGHVYAVPRDRLAQGDVRWSDYDVPALAGAPVRTASTALARIPLRIQVALPQDPAPQAVAATVVNTDDARLFGTTADVNDGAVDLRVPAGHYSVIVFGITRLVHPASYVQWLALAVDQNVTAGGSHTIDVDLAAAQQNGFPTYHVATDPTVEDELADYEIQDGRGRDTGGSWLIQGGPKSVLRVAAAGPAQYGGLVSLDATEARGANGSRYYLTHAHPDSVVPDEQVTVPTAELATVRRSYYSDGTSLEASAARTPIYPYADPGVLSFAGAPMPGRRTEYLFAPTGVLWLNDVQAGSDDAVEDLLGFASYAPGSVQREDLWRGPLAPGVAVQPEGAKTYPDGGVRTCWVCRTSTGLVAGFAPVVSTTAPSYGGRLYAGPGEHPAETRLSVYRDGTSVYSVTNSEAGIFTSAPAQISAPTDAHRYRIVATTDRFADGLTLSTSSTTVYRFTSAAGDGARLGSGWNCGAPGAGRCRVLPLLAVQVPLATSLTGSLPAAAAVDVTIGHVQGAEESAIAGFSLSARTDGGSWVPQSVHALGGGKYRVLLDVPASSGAAVDLQWQASDVSGSSIVQTVDGAYRVA